MTSSPATSEDRAAYGWHFGPTYALRSTVPFKKIMKTMTASFAAGHGDRELTLAIQDFVREDERLADLIDVDAPRSGGPLARRGLVFEECGAWRLFAHGPGLPERGAAWRIQADRVPAGSWRSPLKALRWPRRPRVPQRRRDAFPGGALTRREHASVELQSPAGARIIFDPVFESVRLDSALAMPVPEPGVTAAFVTHSHEDHFDLATLDHLAAHGTTIYVPTVPRRSLLAEDMDWALGLSGLPGKTCATGSLTTIDDVTVEALPFFGEQPSALVSPAEPGIRNWGCCYRVDTPYFSALLLADSGSDPDGNMIAAVSDSVRRRGKIDMVLGCLRNIYLPFMDEGLPTYYAVLPVSGLRTDYELLMRGKLPSATLGVSGTAAVCAAAGATTFLPYAHGITGYGQPIGVNPFGPGRGIDELSACNSMAEELRRIGCGTAVLNWNPGDCWTPRGVVEPAASPV